jgi:type I restriction enzyme R subunit
LSNFQFLQNEWAELHENAIQAEGLLNDDPRSACFYARRSLEVLVRWLYDSDPAYTYPYNDSLNSLIKDANFQGNVPLSISLKADYIRRQGNTAVHSTRAVRKSEAFQTVKELFHLCYWLARTYTRGDPAKVPAKFDESLIPPSRTKVHKQSAVQLQALQADLEARDAQLREQQKQLTAYKEKITALQAQVQVNRETNSRVVVDHDYNEAETRKYLIDVLLKESGWDPHAPNAAEYRVEGMPNQRGTGYVDYVLWGADGLPLAVVEAKRTTASPEKGRQQAKLYADCLENQFKRRPVIFYTNGLDTWLWDDTQYPPRKVQGFYTVDELERMIQRRTLAKSPTSIAPKTDIVERYYQLQAIRSICEHLEKRYRRALLVMATGTGKTRVSIALVDVLMRAGWVKNVLFLADRTSLVKQALGAFKRHLPECNPVSVLDGKEEARHARVVLSTYQSMMGMIDSVDDRQQKYFGSGHFDLVIIDEAHRSVYHKFGAIFDYFDSLLIGLTATPKDDVDRNTYQLFNLEDGVPNFNYDLEQAVQDGYLVPPRAISVPLKFLRQGIKYDELGDDEKLEWELLDWGENAPPDHVTAASLNRWLFNQDTVDQVLMNIMEHGIKVKGGDRLGKTIIFAKNHPHAEFILERFNANYPEQAGRFAQVIDNYVNYAQSLIDDFSKKDDPPHIAISVDMLDTGIDIPEAVNLVFFKAVHSKTKFLQMIGRGTRLCPDLFGPGEDKREFVIFDYCQNFEYFNENPRGYEGREQIPLQQQLFQRRLDLIEFMQADFTGSYDDLLKTYRDDLHEIVAGLNLENFIVRPQRKYVEPFRNRARWDQLTSEDIANLDRYVSGLPLPNENDEEAAKRFDLLVFSLQLAILEGNVRKQNTFQNRIMRAANNLLQMTSIPLVRAQVPLLQRLLEDDYWQEVSILGLNDLREPLRGLMNFIRQTQQNPLFTDFQDEIREGEVIYIVDTGGGVNVEQYQRKVQHFLQAHLSNRVIRKVRFAMQLTKEDLNELEEMFFSAEGIGDREAFRRIYGENKSLPAFVRSLAGLDRGAAKAAFSDFLDTSIFTADQITFINYIIDHLAANGSISEELLYEDPFTDLNDMGVDGVFSEPEVLSIFNIIRRINETIPGFRMRTAG